MPKETENKDKGCDGNCLPCNDSYGCIRIAAGELQLLRNLLSEIGIQDYVSDALRELTLAGLKDALRWLNLAMEGIAEPAGEDFQPVKPS